MSLNPDPIVRAHNAGKLQKIAARSKIIAQYSDFISTDLHPIGGFICGF